MKFLNSFFILIILFSVTGLNGSGMKQPDMEKRQSLEKGEIIIDIKKHPLTDVANPTGQCLVEASVKDVWHVITDFDSFGKFMPNIVYYKPEKFLDESLLVNCKVKVGFMKFKYQLIYQIDENKHTTYWSYVKGSGPINDARGYWRIEPFNESHVLVTYTTTMDAGALVPGWIERSLTKSSFPDVFKNLRKRVKDLKAKGPISKPLLMLKK